MYANKELSMMTLDVIGRVAFGFDFNAMKGSGLVPHAERFMQEITNAFAYIPYWHLLPTPVRPARAGTSQRLTHFVQGNNSMRKAMEVMTGKAQEVLRERRKQLDDSGNEGYPDLLHVLLQPDHVTGAYLEDEVVRHPH